MKIVVLPESKKDFKWWGRYYRSNFPSGNSNASRHLDAVFLNLAANPSLGREIEGTSLRQIPIVRTPFIVVYRVKAEELQIIRVWDGRQDPKRKIETRDK